jgi:hypothetical protein
MYTCMNIVAVSGMFERTMNYWYSVCVDQYLSWDGINKQIVLDRFGMICNYGFKCVRAVLTKT